MLTSGFFLRHSTVFPRRPRVAKRRNLYSVFDYSRLIGVEKSDPSQPVPRDSIHVDRSGLVQRDALHQSIIPLFIAN